MTSTQKPSVLRGGMIGAAPCKWDNKTATVMCRVSFDCNEHIYLLDHLIKGKPVLPLTFALNMMLETAAEAFPDCQINSVTEFRVLSGIVLLEKKEVCVEIKMLDDGKTLFATVYSDVPKYKPHFSAKLGSLLLPKVSPPFAMPRCSSSESISWQEIYSSLLFHGDIFKGVRFAEIIDHVNVYGVVSGVPPLLLRSNFSGYRWFIDPVALDCAMQVSAILTNSVLKQTVLPTGFGRLEMYQELGQQSMQVCVQFTEKISEVALTCNVTAFDDANKVIFKMTGLQGLPIKLNA